MHAWPSQQAVSTHRQSRTSSHAPRESIPPTSWSAVLSCGLVCRSRSLQWTPSIRPRNASNAPPGTVLGLVLRVLRSCQTPQTRRDRHASFQQEHGCRKGSKRTSEGAKGRRRRHKSDERQAWRWMDRDVDSAKDGKQRKNKVQTSAEHEAVDR